MRKISRGSLCKLLAVLLTLNMIFPLFEHRAEAVEKRFQIAYDFEDSDPHTDFEGKYNILSSSKIVIIDGRDGGKAAESLLNLSNRIFQGNTASTIGFWINLENFEDGGSEKTIFYAGQDDGGKPSLKISYHPADKTISAVLSDGSASNTLTGSVSELSGWFHIAVAYETSDTAQEKQFVLYLNGLPVYSAVVSLDMSSFQPSATYFSECKLDDIYTVSYTHLPLAVACD